jgi:hypothetical protein
VSTKTVSSVGASGTLPGTINTEPDNCEEPDTMRPFLILNSLAIENLCYFLNYFNVNKYI